ncbi:cupin domain-containing protein [Aliishimia ponticola]|uniref:Cupin domain-containing protein n=1 Tax=Aliishimia ponticola TaxID=2499833 RepID=A0A4S4N859_9RHOB|nr:cupin domain-containing protein [Aliishimia ponticola]THH35384.1 cupin domain-containing protein [Aliishimia ponticola]
MQHFKAGARPSTRPNPDYFTGDVWFDPVMSTPAPARLNALVVRFDPGARTAWHTHPLGQTLYVLSGKGLICRRGEAPQVILPGDTVWFDQGEEHWHGAAPDVGMTHLAMQEADETGSAAVWLEKVTDADYRLDTQDPPERQD